MSAKLRHANKGNEGTILHFLGGGKRTRLVIPPFEVPEWVTDIDPLLQGEVEAMATSGMVVHLSKRLSKKEIGMVLKANDEACDGHFQFIWNAELVLSKATYLRFSATTDENDESILEASEQPLHLLPQEPTSLAAEVRRFVDLVLFQMDQAGRPVAKDEPEFSIPL
jgi:hypothetical protein